MAKKQITTYKFSPGNVIPDTNLYPNTYALLEANKKFIQEETIAYIQYNVTNNISPYIFYTYNAAKCRRDVSYVLEGYISDLRKGGNWQTVNNASKYFENGIPQVDGDRQPEVFAHTFISNLIQNFILENIAFSARQTEVDQVIDNGIVAEEGGKLKLADLADIIITVIDEGLSALPATVSNRGFVKFPGYYKLKDILLITNTTRNVIMYNFADPSLAADLTYKEDFDSDFPGALYGTEKITTLIFDYDTSQMMVTDAIQIFVEAKEQTVRLNSIGTDAMERQKVGIPQSMLDADFEYGLQPTKWQAIGLLRNYPSVYEIPGSDLSVLTVVTDASVGTGSSGSSLITVTCQSAHSLAVGNPFTIKALANSVTGFSRAEGTFLVNSVPSSTTFTYFAKSKVGTTNGQQLSSTYTQLRRAAYYTGAAVGNPSFSVFSNGFSGNITTSLITLSGTDIIGFTGTVPPVGSPLSGVGITTGTQITAVTGNGGVAASTTLINKANIGDTSITVTSTTNIGPGLLINRGDGAGIAVTDVIGNILSLNGALTSAINGTNETYPGLTQTSTSGTGSGAVFSVSRSGATYLTTVSSPGNGYATNDTITIAGTNLSGAAPANTATITVTSASAKNTVSSLDNTTLVAGKGYSTDINVTTTAGAGTGLTVNISTDANSGVEAVSINSPGSGYSAGATVTINQVFGRALETSTLLSSGTGYATGSNVPTTGGTGTGLVVSIVADPKNGAAKTPLVISNAGTGYSDGLKTTTTLTGTGSGLTVICLTQGTGTIQSALVSNGGSGYASGNTVQVNTGGANAVLTITNVANGAITEFTVSSRGSGYTNGDTITIASGSVVGASAITVGEQYIITVLGTTNWNTVAGTTGQTYTVGSTFTAAAVGTGDGQARVTGGSGATFNVTSVSEAATIQILSVQEGGVIQSVSTSGTPITAPSNDFISSITLNAVTISQIASENTGISYGAISIIQVDFTTAHGFVPGNTITTQITSSGTNAQLAAGAYFVEQVPTTTSLRYTARAIGAISNTLTGIVYSRPDSFFLHRPFDGGVQLGTGGSAHGASAIRMSKKYIRYQSGKGVMYNTGALFAPSYDLRTLVADGTAIGSTITINTDDTDHGCQVGAQVTISGVTTSGYNGIYTVSDIIDERTFSVIAYQTLGNTTAVLGTPCQMSIRQWHGSTVRAGIFDDQNGMFYQYDGKTLAVVRRSSTSQLAGVIAVNSNSNLVTGSNTRFSQQLAAGDKIVIRGMSHVVTQVISDTSMTMAPDWRGVSDVSNVKVCKTIDIIVPQDYWNNDPCNGSGPSGYQLDISKMQMIGIQHTWYGAGFIDFMLRGPDGNYIFVHRFRNSNVNTEAYMRTGNQPVRYEVVNEGAKSKLTADMNDSQTTIPIEDSYFFPTAGTVLVDSELIRYTGNINNTLSGCVRGSSLVQFVAGAQRTFTSGAAAAHSERAGVVLVSNTITPIISHWGSAFMIDGQFDSDRGYIFSYAATGFSASVERVTAFLIRLAPSVSNAQTGDLGEKELLNRAQLLLGSISVTSDPSTGGGAILVEGVLNPSNYPEDPTKITWTGLSSQAAGGQPSFAQIASGGSVIWGGGASTSTANIQGAFTTTLTARSFAPATQTLTATSFNAVNQTLTAASFTPATSATYNRAFSTTRTDFLISTASFDALQTTLSVNDTLSATTFLTSGQRISSITRDFINLAGVSYTRIVMSRTANVNSTAASSNNGSNVNCTAGSTLATTYAAALSSARTDFLITQTQFASVTIAVTDVLSATTFLTGGQTISSTTANFCRINNVAYARIVMSSNATSSSTAGGGNNITVTSTSAATARYGSALSTARTDFLITDASFSGLGIALGDTLSIPTFITGGQTITGITQTFINIGGTNFTRIVMSAAANATSTSGSGNDQTVTATASGSAATYNGTNFLFFTSVSWIASGAVIGTRVATDQTAFPAGTSVNGITTRTFGATTVYRVNFTQASNTTLNASSTLKFQFGAQYALPGEQVFSFVSNPGSTDTLQLTELKELTATALGGRGTFPNGPDVLAINVFKVSGTATPANVILRWGEAQA
jgi:hypothetical protein